MTGLHASFAPSFLRIAAGALALAALIAAGVPASAQTITNKFGGLSGESKEPIDIESDMLVVHDKQKLATFKGNVKAVQGKTILQATELDVHYAGGDRLGIGGAESTGATPQPAAEATPQPAAEESDAAPAKQQDEGNTQITKIEAKGNVVITGQDNQTTTSDWALYDVPSQLVTVGGNVVLTQGENVLKGDRLVIDLKTGQSRFEHTASSDTGGGRIRALFMPKGGVPKGVKPGEAKPEGNAKPAAGAEPGNGRFGEDAPLPLDPMRQQ